MPKSSSATRTPTSRSAMQAPDGTARVVQHHGLGHLSSSRSGGTPASASTRRTRSGEVGLHQLQGRDIDSHGQVGAARGPRGRLAQLQLANSLMKPQRSAAEMNSPGDTVRGSGGSSASAHQRLDADGAQRRRPRPWAGSADGTGHCSPSRSATSIWLMRRLASPSAGPIDHGAASAGTLGVVERGSALTGRLSQVVHRHVQRRRALTLAPHAGACRARARGAELVDQVLGAVHGRTLVAMADAEHRKLVAAGRAARSPGTVWALRRSPPRAAPRRQRCGQRCR